MPQVFHVGPPRTATTWTWEVLRGRVGLCEEYKEINFFAQNLARGLEWYLAHFEEPVSQLPRVDFEPEYFGGTVARERIVTLLPRVKIICSLREPVGRLFSLYKILVRSTSLPPYKFEDACEKDWRLAESARYGFYLRKWIEAVGASRVLVLFYDDLLADPQQYIEQICDFIGIERFKLRPEQRSRVLSSERFTLPNNQWWGRLGRSVGELIWELGDKRMNYLVRRLRLSKLFFDNGMSFTAPDAAVVQRIRMRLRPEIELVEQLTGRDLSAWKGPVYEKADEANY
ncbi:MAG: sulfotransferase [Deltaproteobacteria bacterium]|nr:sulfotransferase [Deltaproteobacteria bacterium]